MKSIKNLLQGSRKKIHISNELSDTLSSDVSYDIRKKNNP